MKVLIIGGGPAGCSAAIWLRQNGFQTTLIESSNFPRNKPGEILHPGVEQLFNQLGILKDI
jgi:2-polyprenyl-6-methoxyphenol hydroxylase-like FAD-dependent oxidoreductase